MATRVGKLSHGSPGPSAAGTSPASGRAWGNGLQLQRGKLRLERRWHVLSPSVVQRVSPILERSKAGAARPGAGMGSILPRAGAGRDVRSLPALTRTSLPHARAEGRAPPSATLQHLLAAVGRCPGHLGSSCGGGGSWTPGLCLWGPGGPGARIPDTWGRWEQQPRPFPSLPHPKSGEGLPSSPPCVTPPHTTKWATRSRDPPAKHSYRVHCPRTPGAPPKSSPIYLGG